MARGERCRDDPDSCTTGFAAQGALHTAVEVGDHGTHELGIDVVERRRCPLDPDSPSTGRESGDDVGLGVEERGEVDDEVEAGGIVGAAHSLGHAPRDTRCGAGDPTQSAQQSWPRGAAPLEGLAIGQIDTLDPDHRSPEGEGRERPAGHGGLPYRLVAERRRATDGDDAAATRHGPGVLRLRVVDDAVLVPRARLGDTSLGAGVLRRTDRGLVALGGAGVRRRGREYVLPPPTDPVVPSRRLEAAVFGGFLYDHYGHFLLESLGRLWFEGAGSDHPIVWIAATGGTWRPWMTELADLVGIGPDRVVLNAEDGALEVGSLLVGDQGFEVHRYLHPWFLERLAVVESPRPAPTDGAHVWLSRSGLGEIGGVDEEAQIEHELVARGWTVVHPEQMSVAEQVEVLSGAVHVAGIEGSAFHTLLLLRGFAGTVDVLTRHDSPNFEVINRTQRLDLERHSLVGGEARVWNRPNGSRDVGWTGVDVAATVALLSSTCARHAV